MTPHLQPAPDSLRAVLDSVFAQPAYQWVEVPHPLGWLGRLWNRLVDALATMQQTRHWLFVLLIALLAAVLLVIVVHAIVVLLRTLNTAAGPEDRAANLPERERHDARWYAAQSDALARSGRYAEALESAFLSLVLELDQRGVLRFHPSKTPREYGSEPPAQEDRERLRHLVRLLYRFVFGGAACGPDDYRAWRELAAGEWHVAPS